MRSTSFYRYYSTKRASAIALTRKKLFAQQFTTTTGKQLFPFILPNSYDTMPVLLFNIELFRELVAGAAGRPRAKYAGLRYVADVGLHRDGLWRVTGGA